MQNINRNIGDNLGGLAAFYFAAVEDLVSIPAPLAGVVSQNIVLRAGATFYAFYCTRDTLQFTEPESQDKQGTRYAQQLKGFIAKDTPALSAALDQLKGRRFVVIYQDNNGHFKLVGSKQYYLTFQRDLDTANNPAGRNGVAFSFRGESADRANFYTGSFPVSEMGQAGQPPEDPAANLVTIQTATGRVLATLLPGQKFVIRSAFSIAFDII